MSKHPKTGWLNGFVEHLMSLGMTVDSIEFAPRPPETRRTSTEDLKRSAVERLRFGDD